LFDAAEGKPVQDELSEMRVLFELLGFLLKIAARALWPRRVDTSETPEAKARI